MLKVKLIFFILLTMSLGFHVPSDAFAADGDVTSTVEINSSTANFPTLDNGDRLGSSLANIGDLNGDGVNDIASGTYWDDEGGLNRGAVHIMFMNADGSVDSTVVINDSTANGPVLANSDGFGFSVANIGDLDGDGVNDIAAGGIEPTLGGAPAAGEIYIMFMNTDGTPKSTVEIDKTTANGPSGAGGHFGSDIANIGDLNGDGVNDLAVGSYGDDTGGGAVHIIFMNTDGTPKSSVEIDKTTANGPTIDDEDHFGRSVENIGDLDGDGVNDLAVGAEYDDMDENGNASGGDNRGAIHIMFMNTDGTPKSTVEINSSTANGPTIDDDDLFGASIANMGDLNGDGVNDIASGTQFDDEGGSNRGAVHIMFMNADGSVDSTVEINSSTTNGPTIDDDDRLGSSLANIGDSNGDGINDLAVGAHNDDEGGSNRGAIHIMFMVGSDSSEEAATDTTKKGGSRCLDCTAPSIGISNNFKDPVRVIDEGFTLNEKSFDVREFAQIYDTIHTETGVTNTIQLKIYEDSKPENIRKAILFLGLDSSDIHRNLACIVWENDSRGEKTITIVDKYDLFENESATSTIVDDLLLLNYTFTSKIPIPFSTIGVELRDNQYNFGLNYFENVIKVSGNPLISSTGTVSKNNSVDTLIVDTFQHESSESQNDVTSSEFESSAPFELPSIMIADTSQWGFSDTMTKRYLADIEETIKENDSKIQALRNADAPKEIPVVELELPRIEENLLQIEQEKAQLILNEILRKDIHNWRESYISHTSEIDIKQLSTLTGIPYDSLQPWMSNLEMWVTEGKIDSADLIVAVEYLINQ